jgi:hypothetical protein
MLLQHQGAITEFPKMEPPPAGNPKSLPVPQIAMPTFDDEDTIVIRRDTQAGANTTTNFLDAAFGFQQGQND